MLTIPMKNFDIDKISRSGQCFRLRKRGTGERYSLVAFGEYLEIGQQGEELSLSCTEEEWEARWKDYFDCGTDYDKIYASIDRKDAYLGSAVCFGRGIRILRQELFETIICFLISQQNNIPRITKCVDTLCGLFGEKKRNFRGEEYYAFPSPEHLAALSSADLAPCRLGYRDRYVLETSRMIAAGGVDIKKLPRMSCGEAKKELMKLCGVGVKVADCICLFSLHHTDAFPIDTHIRSVLLKYYPDGFPLSRYQGYAGILQQYAFFYDLYGEEEASFSGEKETQGRR